MGHKSSSFRRRTYVPKDSVARRFVLKSRPISWTRPKSLNRPGLRQDLSYRKALTLNQFRRLRNQMEAIRRFPEMRRVLPDLHRKLVCGRRQIRKEVLHALGITREVVRRGTGGGNPQIRC